MCICEDGSQVEPKAVCDVIFSYNYIDRLFSIEFKNVIISGRWSQKIINF